jgi:hypothetical protein
VLITFLPTLLPIPSPQPHPFSQATCRHSRSAPTPISRAHTDLLSSTTGYVGTQPPPPVMPVASRGAAVGASPLSRRHSGLPHAVVQCRSSRETPYFRGAHFATLARAPCQPSPLAWATSCLRNHRVQDGPKGTFAPLSVRSWHWP